MAYKFSFFDVVPIVVGGSVAQSLANVADLAREAESHGYHRYWVAEHHGMPGIASAATAVVIGHIAAATSTIRVGAGGIMLPNHSPLVIAEQFGTLDALFPGRIDLGLGRAPGSDQIVAHALRRSLTSDANEFPADVAELQSLFADDGRSGIRATPGGGARPEMWILGSSLFGAQLAASMGLPFAFASHFAPDSLDRAMEIYRRHFRPSVQLPQPYAMAGFNVFAADTDAEAELLSSSSQQWFRALRSGMPGRLPRPVPNYRTSLSAGERAGIDQMMQCTVIGGPEKVADGIAAFVKRTGIDEILITSAIYDHDARKHSMQIAAAAMQPDLIAA